MSSPSNLYAEKIFAEHPIALWALDDDAHYISLISEEQRDLSNWNITGGTSALDNTFSDEPFIASKLNRITGQLTSEDSGQIVCVSEDIINFTDLNSSFSTFSVGGYFYSPGAYLAGIEIGYEYYDTSSGNIIQELKRFNTSIQDKWIFVSETFDIPDDNTTARLVFKINYIGGATSTDEYQFLVNGISFGQWSEEFNSTSIGQGLVDLPSSIAISNSKCIVANSYGLQDSKGYYLTKDNALVARNTGMPMVYGSDNVTGLFYNDEKPSFIVPGFGFLNKTGIYQEYTFESWIRLVNRSNEKRRILGPIASDDGIYIDGPFIILKVGSNYGSHFIGEWGRPMLLDIRIIRDNASLLINGEEVISLNFKTSELVFPDKENADGDDQDWIGFYGYDDIYPFEIDCIAIYSYQVPALVAKRRFAYGQAVEFPENINTAYSGSSVFVDYPFADYSNNYMYPDIGNWSQAIVDNLSITNNILSTPEYKLPTISLKSNTQKNLFAACKLIQNENDPLFTFMPNSQWSSNEGYLLFDNINVLNNKTAAFFGVFKAKVLPTEPETLFYIGSDNSNKYISIELVGSEVHYYISDQTEPFYKAINITTGDIFSVGIHFDTLSNHFNDSIASFLGNRSALKLYVGGNKDLTNTFRGNIYKVGFCSDRNYNSVSELFNSSGTPLDHEDVFEEYMNTLNIIYDAGSEYFGNNPGFYNFVLDGGTPTSYSATRLIEHTASYTLVPTVVFDNFDLDIDISAYWEDNIPLTYFAQYVTDAKGDSFYDLDFMQFNINYPASAKFERVLANPDTWTYAELKSSYSNPVQRTYDSLDNFLFTGYEDYQDLKDRSTGTYKYDTNNESVRSYITFQFTKDGANASENRFVNVERAPKSAIVEPGDEWVNTKYEVVDNMILYPPTGAAFDDLSVVIHLEFVVKNSLKNKVNLKSLQLCSQSFNEASPNAINTRFGNSLYPYVKNGYYYSYKDRNPYTIYKGSSPYLYMTRTSGLELKGVYDPLINRGISIPINQHKESTYKVMAMQAALKYDQEFFPYAPTEFMEVESKDYLIKFFLVANHQDGKRAKIYAVNMTTGKKENGIGFYWNGKLVREPVITLGEWGFLGILFSNVLDFSNYTGNINFNGPIMFNTVSHYKTTSIQEIQDIQERPWFKVKRVGPFNFDWEYWDEAPPSTWQGVLVLSTKSFYGVDPALVYQSYTGTNKIIVDSDKTFSLTSYQYKASTDILWQQTTQNAL